MVVLGAAGGAVGEGAGKALAVVGGMIVGAVAGTAAEGAAQPHDAIAYTIRVTDGRVVIIVHQINLGDRLFNVGSAVTIETSGHEQQVILRTP